MGLPRRCRRRLIEREDLLVEGAQGVEDRGEGEAQRLGNMLPGLAAEVLSLRCREAVAEALDGAAHGVDEQAAGLDQLGVGAEHGQMLLRLLGAMVDGEERARVDAG